MAISLQDFSKLLVQSKLISEEQYRQYLAKFAKETGQKDPSAKAMAEWLLRQKLLSKYQASILLAGRPGPFLFGPYKIFDRIEGGRLHKIFRAVHTATNHPVLLKLLSNALAENARLWEEMLRWLPITAHPNLTRSYEVLDQGKNKLLVMQDLRGETVADYVKRKKRLAPDEACKFVRAAAVGLAWLHDHQVIHGDIRPSNLWLDQEAGVKVFVEPDIGTRVFRSATADREPDCLVRADYAAPEFTQAGRTADVLTDIYALGCTFYELVSGSPPFAGGDVAQKLHRHASEPIQPLDALGVPAPLVQRIAYMMAKNPAVRYQSAQIVADQLAQFVTPVQVHVGSPGESAGAAGFESWLQQQSPSGGRLPQGSPAQKVSAAAPPYPAAPTGPQPPAATLPSAESVSASRPAYISPAPHAAGGDVPSPGFVPEQSALPSIEFRRRGKVRRKNSALPIIASALLLLVIAIGGIYLWKNPALWNPQVAETGISVSPPEKPSAIKKPDGKVPATGETEQSANNEAVRRGPNGARNLEATIVEDDGQSLWSSPTQGAPIDLKYVPAGVQFLFVARPSDMFASAEGRRVLKALGPQFEVALAKWEPLAGVPLPHIEQLIVGLYPNPGEFPRFAFVVRVVAPFDPEDLLAKWGQPKPVEGGSNMYQKDDWAYYVPDKRTFVMGPYEPLLKDAAQPPLLRREIGELVQLSDGDRHVTAFFTPTFLLGDGQTLFTGDLVRAVPFLEWLLGDGIQAAMLSLHFADQFYFELRMESDIEIDRHKLASQIRERIAEIPEATELYVANLNPHPYWRLVANRYPGMIRFFHQQSRIGVEGNHAIVNAVLPGVAAHNLVFGGEMLVASAPGTVVAAVGPAPSASGPKTVDEVLKSRISISFAQESLEFAMQNVASEVTSAFPNLPFEFKIKILGSDLEKDGITRNQQVRDFDQADKPVADVLTAMVRKANPITTVKDPSELDQKLVWVVGPDPDNAANQIVLITTRTGAEQKKYTVPEVFRPK